MSRLVLCPFLLALGVITAARADEMLDGTQSLLCASSAAFDCSGDAACVATSPEDLNVPDLMRVDPGTKSIRALDLEQRDLSSAIGSLQVVDERLVLSGNDGEGRGWTLAIHQETGDSVLTVNDATTALIVFGECTRI